MVLCHVIHSFIYLQKLLYHGHGGLRTYAGNTAWGGNTLWVKCQSTLGTMYTHIHIKRHFRVASNVSSPGNWRTHRYFHKESSNSYLLENWVVRNTPVKPFSGPSVEQEKVSECGGGWWMSHFTQTVTWARNQTKELRAVRWLHYSLRHHATCQTKLTLN